MKNLKEELRKQRPEAQARHKRVLANPKSKEARLQNRKFGLLMIGLGLILAAPQALAYWFNDIYYFKLLIATILISIYGLFTLLTGWIPKVLRR